MHLTDLNLKHWRRPAHSLILVTAHVLLMCSLLLFTGTIQDVFWNTPVLFGVVWYLCQLQGCLINCVTSKLIGNKLNYLTVWSLGASWLKEWVYINTVHVGGRLTHWWVGRGCLPQVGISLVCNLTGIFTEWLTTLSFVTFWYILLSSTSIIFYCFHTLDNTTIHYKKGGIYIPL